MLSWKRREAAANRLESYIFCPQLLTTLDLANVGGWAKVTTDNEREWVEWMPFSFTENIYCVVIVMPYCSATQ